MPRRIVTVDDIDVAQTIASYEDDLAAAAIAGEGEDDNTITPGKGANVVMLVSPTLAMSVYLPRRFVYVFGVSQPAIPAGAKFFRIEETLAEGETPAETTRHTRAQKSKGKTTDLSRVSYTHIKVATDGLATTPTRTYRGAQQKLKYVAARFPKLLTRDCINWLITNGFGGGAETDNRLPTHFLYGGSNFRVDYTSVASSDLAVLNV